MAPGSEKIIEFGREEARTWVDVYNVAANVLFQ